MSNIQFVNCMRKIYTLALLLVIFGFFQKLNAQRYTSEVFNHVKITDGVVYGQNITIMTTPAKTEDLKMTVYEPAGDTLPNRPLVIYLHTGNFLPKGFNQSATGQRQDSCVVEICKQLAKRGYVVAAASYRLGWNPLASDQNTRTSTLLQAVYRAIQDTKTAVRYFRKNHATENNMFGVDPSNIMLLGQGSGGYVALAYATLNDPNELLIPKFYDFSVTPAVPYVDSLILRNFDGYRGNSSYNIENHVGYSNDIKMVANMGGALGDSIWLEKGEVPMVSFHCPNDPSAPYKYGTVVVPTIGNVVEVSGSHDLQRLIKGFGNNDVFVNANYTDAFTVKANSMNDGYEGLYPFYVSSPQSAPWEWWSTSDSKHQNSLQTNPDMSKTKGMAYIDTIMGYLIPRTVTVLNLQTSGAVYIDPAKDKDTTIVFVGIHDNVYAGNNNITLFPNPVSGEYITVMSNNQSLINSVELFDVTGKQILFDNNLNNNSYTLSIANLSSGLYFIKSSINGVYELNKLIVE